MTDPIEFNFGNKMVDLRNKFAGLVVDNTRLAELLAAGETAEEIARLRAELEEDPTIETPHDFLVRFGEGVKGIFGKARE